MKSGFARSRGSVGPLKADLGMKRSLQNGGPLPEGGAGDNLFSAQIPPERETLQSICSSCYAICGKVSKMVEGLPVQSVLKEDCRKSGRLLKRVDVLISDLEPYAASAGEGPAQDQMILALQEIKVGMADVANNVGLVASKGPLATYMQGDRLLSGFSAAAGRLDVALGLVARAAEPHQLLPEETKEELGVVRNLLQRTNFEPSPDHAAVMESYREGVQTIQSGYEQTLSAVAKIVRSISNGADTLTKEGFQYAKEELVKEHDCITTHGDTYNDSLFLRMMLDILRAHNQGPANVPLAYICPISHQVMQDPVILQETGHSYERKAIENWFNKGHHYCPRTGKALSRKLCVIDNPNLRDAIGLWAQDNALKTAFRPIVESLMKHKQYEAELEQMKATLQEEDRQLEEAHQAARAKQAALREATATAEATDAQQRPNSSSSGAGQVNLAPFGSSKISSFVHNAARPVAAHPQVHHQEDEQCQQLQEQLQVHQQEDEQCQQLQEQEQQANSHVRVSIQPRTQQEQGVEEPGKEAVLGAAVEQQQQQQGDPQVLPPNQEQVQQAMELHSPSFSEESFLRSQPASEARLLPKQMYGEHQDLSPQERQLEAELGQELGQEQLTQQQGSLPLRADLLPPSSTCDAVLNATLSSYGSHPLPPQSLGSSIAQRGSRVDEEILHLAPSTVAPSVCGSEAVPPPAASEDAFSLHGANTSAGDMGSMGGAASVGDGHLGRAASSLGDVHLGRAASSIAGDGSITGQAGGPGSSVAGSAAGDAPQVLDGHEGH